MVIELTKGIQLKVPTQKVGLPRKLTFLTNFEWKYGINLVEKDFPNFCLIWHEVRVAQ